MRKDQSQPYDKAALDRLTRQAVFDIVRGQAHAGIDIVNDGEMSKPGYSTYVADRLSGFSGHEPAKPRLDTRDHPNILVLTICYYILATSSRPKGDRKTRGENGAHRGTLEMECEGGGRNTTHRRVKRSLCAVILIICFSIVMCQTSSANNITYTYVGNPFTLFAGIDQCAPQCNVSGWFTISDAPLHPYPGFSSPVAIIHNDITFSFTDGLNTITQDNASSVDFELAIGSSGHFDFTIGWCIYVGMGIANGTPLLNIDTISNGLGCVGTNDETYLFGTLPFFSLQVLGDAIVTENPGTWSATTVPSPVPEPRSLLLLGTGAMILLVVVRRKSKTFANRTTG